MVNKYIARQEAARKGNVILNYSKSQDKPSGSKHFDPEAPRFAYRRRVGSFTRKSNKLHNEQVFNRHEEIKPRTKFDLSTDNILRPGFVSRPSTEKQEHNQYASTKPMIGWERIFVGQGKWIAQGRRKAKKNRVNLSQESIIPAYSPDFVPFARTYKNSLRERYNVVDERAYDEYRNKFVKTKRLSREVSTKKKGKKSGNKK